MDTKKKKKVRQGGGISAKIKSSKPVAAKPVKRQGGCVSKKK